MLSRCIKYYYLLSTALLWTCHSSAQLGGLGGPLLSINFGHGATGDQSVPGPALQLGHTDIPYTTDVCPPPGFYAVVSSITTSCFNDSWIPLLADNTPFPDENGYMMLINDVASASPKILFTAAVRDLCSDVHYQFSASAINVDKASAGCNRFSSLILQVEDTHGNVIASTSTGDIQFAVYSMGYHFTKYVVNFMIPATDGEVVVKIIDQPKSSSTNCSNAFALDDIQVKVTGPKMSIGFVGAPISDWVKSACFQTDSSFAMFGNIDAGIANPAVQWQRSNDDGNSWTDIPGATGYSYTQNFPVADTFLFRLRGSDSSLIGFANCGISSNLLKVQVNGIPSSFRVSNNSPLCAGEDLIFDVSGGASYIWSGPNGFTETAPYAHKFNSTLADSGRYYVQIISMGGCVVTDSTDVVMLGVDVKAGDDTIICKGNSVLLHASGGNNYQWIPADGLSDASIANPVATPLITTNYTVNVKDVAGCTNKGTVKVQVKNSVKVNAAFASPAYVCRSYDSARFTDQSIGNIALWKWDFSNGQTSALPNPPLQFYSIGNNYTPYVIRLTVQDSAGCADSATHLLQIADNCYIAVPGAFSPNGDGMNDFLYPVNAYKATKLFFKVYNRNGQTLFVSEDWTKKWDGTFHGQPQDPGTYVWTLQYRDEQNELISLKGTTVLIR